MWRAERSVSATGLWQLEVLIALPHAAEVLAAPDPDRDLKPK